MSPGEGGAALPGEGGAPVQYGGERADVLRRVRRALESLERRRVLVRTWLDVSMEVEVLSGVVGEELVVRQFRLTGLWPDAVSLAADGRCQVRLFIHLTRLQNTREETFHLPVALVPGESDGQDVPPRAMERIQVDFSAGQWDAYVIESVRLRAPGPGTYRLQLRAEDGAVLWPLAVKVGEPTSEAEPAEVDGETEPATESGGTDAREREDGPRVDYDAGDGSASSV